MLKLKCTSCHEEHSKLVGVTPSDSHEMTKGARGSANLVMSCSFCKKEGSAKFDDPTTKEPLWRPIEADEDKGAQFQTLCVLDFRGLEPIGFDPQVSRAPLSSLYPAQADLLFWDGRARGLVRAPNQVPCSTMSSLTMGQNGWTMMKR